MNSSRLPGKVLKQINGNSLITILINRLKSAKLNAKIILATTTNESDDLIAQEAQKLDVEYFRGDENDVLCRYYEAAIKYRPSFVTRLTADCPLLDPKIVQVLMEKAKMENLDYCSNVLKESFPDGQDVEVIKFTALEYANRHATLKSDREHVTPFIKRNSTFLGGAIFKSNNFASKKDYSHIRMTVDEEKDFEMIEKLINCSGVAETWEVYVKIIIEKDLYLINSSIERNEGYWKSLKED